MAARVARITIYPMKSCDPVEVNESLVNASGALQHDRRFVLVDADGRVINAKRTALIHRLSLEIDPGNRSFRVAHRDGSSELRGHLDDDGRVLSDWLTNYFSLDVSILENEVTGFPDDLDSPGPTIVSTATLQTVSSWLNGMPLEEVRNRFRANLEIEGVEAFWEDRLYRTDRQPQPVRIGGVVFGGTNPCQRCVVPTRDSQTGEVTSRFAVEFGRRRAEALPEWADRSRFDHFYRLTTNSRLLQRGTGVIRVEDPVEIITTGSPGEPG